MLICSLTLSTSAQSFEYRGSFSALVVKDVDASSQWYQALLSMNVKNKMADANAGYKITILESPTLIIELLELKGSLVRKNLLDGKPDGTQIQGHFKIGFIITDMDACLKQLTTLKINVPQVWTDKATQKRNFLISDPDGNLIQFFEQ